MTAHDSTVRARCLPRRRFGRGARWGLLFASLALAVVAMELLLLGLGLPRDELVFLPKDGTVPWDCYCSNPRGYFTPRVLADGRTIYCVDHANAPPRTLDFHDARWGRHYKILAVGDSFTWGLGVKIADSFPMQLGRSLAAATGVPSAVSNQAHVGRWVAEIYEEMKQAYQLGVPQLCIYGYVLNDPFDDRQGKTAFVHAAAKAQGMDNADIYDGINVRTANLRRLNLESPLSGPRRISRIVELALRQWEWQRIRAHTLAYYRELYDPAVNGTGLARTWEWIEKMHRLQANNAGHFLVVIFPLFVDLDRGYPFEACHQRITQALEARGIAVLDLLPVFRGKRTSDFWVHPLDHHPNEIAQRLVAETIRDWLLTKGWVARSKTVKP